MMTLSMATKEPASRVEEASAVRTARGRRPLTLHVLSRPAAHDGRGKQRKARRPGTGRDPYIKRAAWRVPDRDGPESRRLFASERRGARFGAWEFSAASPGATLASLRLRRGRRNASAPAARAARRAGCGTDGLRDTVPERRRSGPIRVRHRDRGSGRPIPARTVTHSIAATTASKKAIASTGSLPSGSGCAEVTAITTRSAGFT